MRGDLAPDGVEDGSLFGGTPRKGPTVVRERERELWGVGRGAPTLDPAIPLPFSGALCCTADAYTCLLAATKNRYPLYSPI